MGISMQEVLDTLESLKEVIIERHRLNTSLAFSIFQMEDEDGQGRKGIFSRPKTPDNGTNKRDNGNKQTST